MTRGATAVVRALRAFGRFWWDFLVGDTPEVTIAVVVILGVVALVSDAWHVNALAWSLLPLLVVVTLGLSIRQALRGDRSRP